MTRRSTPWGCPGLLALSPAFLAGAEEATAKKSAKTVKKEDVKTWTQTIDGKEWSMRLGTPSYEGDTGLFRLSSAYVLPKGKAAFSLFRDNYDRDPKGIDFSIHGLNAAWGATDKLEVFGQIGLQNRTKVHYTAQPGFYNDLPFAGVDGWQTGFGDIKLGAKYGFLDDYRGDGVGLALRGLVKFGTADEAKGLGTGTSGGRGRPHPLEEPELQGRPACLDRLPVPGRPERGGRRHPRHRQRLQVGHRRQRARLRQVDHPGGGHGPLLQQRRLRPDESRSTSSWDR